MKTSVATVLALLLFTRLYAQGSIEDLIKQQIQPVRMNEIGMKMEFGSSFAGQQNFTGFQLKHFGKKNIGYRLFAGLGTVGTFPSALLPVQAGTDTFIRKSSSVSVTMPIVGGGIEGQHHASR